MNCSSVNLTVGTEIKVDPETQDPAIAIIFLLFVIILVSAAVVGNSFVILAWFTDSKISQNPSNALLVSLAATDLVIGGFAIPFFYIYHLVYKQKWIFGEFLAYMLPFATYSAQLVSSYHLVLIAIDRYRIVKEGIAYVNGKTLGSVLKPVPVLWLAGLLEISPALVAREGTHYCAIDGDSTEGKFKFMHDALYTDTFVFFDTLLVSVIPIATMVFLYSKIFLEVRTRLNRRIPAITVEMKISDPSAVENQISEGISEDVSATTNTEKRTPKERLCKKKDKTRYLNTTKERKLAKGLAVLILAYLVCWVPYCVAAMMKVLRVNIKDIDEIIHYTAILGWINSCTNPILYALSYPDFKIAFKKIPPKIWKKLMNLCNFQR